MVPPLDLMIDDAGRHWVTRSEAIRRWLGAGRPEYDLEDFLLRSMGFVRVRGSGANLIVTLTPGTLSRPTFEAVAWLLVEQDPPRVAIQLLGEPEGIEVISDAEEAVLRIDDLCFEGAAVAGGYHEERLSLSRTLEPRLASLRRQLQVWMSCRGELAAGVAAPPRRLAAGGKLLMARVENTGLRVHHVQNYRFADPAWSEKMLGRDLADAPDPAYAQVISDAFRRTLAGGEPRLELVDATVRVSDASSMRFRYDRLLLPWRSAGRLYVTTSSVGRSSSAISSARKA